MTGGLDIAAEAAGIETAAFCEKDPFCRRVLAKRWADIPIHDDVFTLRGEDIAGTIDVIHGGFPCQPFSVAGRQRGRDDGTLWLNLGDSYFGSSKGAAKNLIGIPWRVAFALQEDGWNLRQDIIWAKPNPMPESVTDRCTKSHEYIFLFSKSPKYYFDADAIREPAQETTVKRCSQSGSTRPLPRYGGKKYTAYPEQFFRTKSGTAYDIRDGRRNKRDVWTVATVPCKEAHFATFPPELIRPCIRAGAPIDGIVLDPFFGSGTTGIVCTQENRNYIGIELNRDYVQIAKRRIEAVERTGRLMMI